MMSKCLIAFFLCAFSLYVEAKEESSPIVVNLETETELLPLYVDSIRDENAGFDGNYLKQLEKVLYFDLNHNGMTYTAAPSTKEHPLSKSILFDDMGPSGQWKVLNIYYVLKVRVKEKELSARMLAVNADVVKTADGLKLTGDIAQDRRIIHRLSDMLHQALFGKEGIAGTKILYTIKQTDPTDKGKFLSTIWETDYDGENTRQIISEEGGYCISPTYIPPKFGFLTSSFFYVSYKNGQPKIFLGSLKEGKSQRLTLLKGNQLMPAISRGRDKVAFISDVTGNPDLFLQSFNPESGPVGKPRQIFSTFKATQGSPSFSPDGSQVAFVSNKDGTPRIYILTIPESGQLLKDVKTRLLTRYSKESTAPAWSPDGTKIAYCAMSEGVRQIFVYDLENDEERRLTKGPGNKENPSWAPNSLHIVYNSADRNASELYIIDLNRPNATRISRGAGEKRFPCWEPRNQESI